MQQYAHLYSFKKRQETSSRETRAGARTRMIVETLFKRIIMQHRPTRLFKTNFHYFLVGCTVVYESILPASTSSLLLQVWGLVEGKHQAREHD